MPTSVAPGVHQVRRRRAGQERVAGEIRGRAEMPRPAGQHQDRAPANVVRQEDLRADGPLGRTPDVDHDAVQLDQSVERRRRARSRPSAYRCAGVSTYVPVLATIVMRPIWNSVPGA